MTENIIDIKGLTFFYEEGKPVLNGVDIAVKRGGITAILGGNGAGKSTLFLNINGVLKPCGGSVSVDGKVIDYSNKDEVKALRRKIGIVFQDPNDQLFAATVKKDVAFGPLNLGLSKEEADIRAQDALEKTGISHLADSPVHALSFGQKKRAAIAGVLAMRSEVIILDEPTAGLDPSGVSEIFHLLTDIKESRGVTVIIATHDIDLVPLYCDYAYVMDKGEVVTKGSPEEIFANANLLRKHFLRLPRISHLMEILGKFDNLGTDSGISTISAARKAVKKLIREGK